MRRPASRDSWSDAALHFRLSSDNSPVIAAALRFYLGVRRMFASCAWQAPTIFLPSRTQLFTRNPYSRRRPSADPPANVNLDALVRCRRRVPKNTSIADEGPRKAMTPDPDPTVRPSPWLSVWLRPRDTISQILAGDPRRHVLILAAIGGIATIAVALFSISIRLETALLDWRMVAGLAVFGALYGIFSLYLSALLLRWCGRLFGGRASQAQLRAVVAWSLLPYILALVLCAGVLVWLNFGGAAAPRTLDLAVRGIMVILAVWAIVIMLSMFARAQGFGFWRTIASGALYGFFLWPVLPLLIRSLLFQPFHSPSGSQIPTLLVGDYLFVSKYAYGYSHYSFPFSPPPFKGRIFGAEPQRGDVVVFRLPRDDSVEFIKRVVGLPGDRIQMRNGELYINGVAVKRERVADFIDTSDSRPARVKRWRETLPNGASYETLDLLDNSFLDNTQEYNVPPGHCFMMGDNRDNSIDSRVLNQVGYVPFENIVGRAGMLYYSVDENGRVRAERIGTLVR
jgi:signal peptidase I